MSIAALFNLDPTQFALGRSTGRFRGIMGNPSQQNQAELGNLLKGIQTVTTERPGEFTAAAPVQPVFGAAPTQPNLPTAPTAPNVAPFTETAPDITPYQGQSLIDKAIAALDRSPVKVNDIASITDIPMYASNYIKSIAEGKPVTLSGFMAPAQPELYNRAKNAVTSVMSQYNAQLDAYNARLGQYKSNVEPIINQYNTDVASYKAAAEPLISKYISDVNAYNTDVKAKTDVYNTDVTAYNKILGEYKSKVETYNTDVNRYQKEVEDTRNKFQKEYLSQNVNQELIPAEGEVLAASSLYSDTLHQEMLNKVAEANASEPSADRVTSLYSTGR